MSHAAMDGRGFTPRKAHIMDAKQDTPSHPEPDQPGTFVSDQATLYRRTTITKIRLRQAIFRARRLTVAPAGDRCGAV